MAPGTGEKGEDPTTTRCYLVRHGESFSNVERRHSAVPPGPGLTARGRAQALRVAELLLGQERTPDILLVSPLRRAEETCAPLAERLEIRPETVMDLREVAAGEWEGMTHATLMERVGYSAWTRDPETQVPPGGERLSEVAARMARALTEAAERHAGRTIAAFSHFDPMIGFYLSVTGQPWSEYPALPLENATILTFDYDAQTRAWQYLGADDRASMRGTDPEDAEAGAPA